MKRAAKLVSGTALTGASAPAYWSGLVADPARTTGEVWDRIRERSDEFVTYFALETDATALRAALDTAMTRGTPGVFRPGESVADAARRWAGDIARDRRALVAGDFSGHEPPGSGFLTHHRDLAIALRDKACLAWGAVDLGPRSGGSGDIMHFDARVDGAGRALVAGTGQDVRTPHPCRSAPATEEDVDPPHVVAAQAAWDTLFPTTKRNVQILDMATAPAKAIARSSFSAWTNSPTTIYVGRPKGSADADYWQAVMFHESLHIDQFAAAGGKPPATYAEMMRYECDAYTLSGQWALARTSATLQGYGEQMLARAKSLCAKITAVEREAAARQNDAYRAYLLTERLLPKHTKLTSLYQPAGDARNPKAAESDVAEETAPDRAKDKIREQAGRWGTDEDAILVALRALTPAEMAEVSTDPSVVDVLRSELSGRELAEVGIELARGRVGSMPRASIDAVLAAPAKHTFGTVAAAMARDVLLRHHEAFDSTGVGTIHGNKCATPKPAGATASDCTEYVVDVLRRAFAAKGGSFTGLLREAVTNSGPGGLKGTEIIKVLQAKLGWEALFWSPDPRNPADSRSEHPAAYKDVRRAGTYYGITVDKDKSVINYRRTNPTKPTDLSGVERLRRLQFGLLAASGGTHLAMIVNGAAYEVHESSPATDRNAIEATPLETFAWLSGTIAAPRGDLALAWRTP